MSYGLERRSVLDRWLTDEFRGLSTRNSAALPVSGNVVSNLKNVYRNELTEQAKTRIMATELTKELLAQMLTAARAKIEEKFDYLNELDSATGDGDHGTAILSTMKAAVEAANQPGTLAQTLGNISMGIMSATGGSTSSLTGAFYLGMSLVVQEDSLTCANVVAMFSSGLDNVKSMTTAKLGDKTMMDAIIPSVEAMKAAFAANDKTTLSELLNAAAEAADQGALSTRDMVAKQGRAKNLGERTVGHLDAGATSFAMIMKAFAQAVQANCVC